MIYHTFELHQEGSLPGAHLVTYIQEHSDAMAINDRPLILLCPGGGYTRTSDREAEPMALKFLAMGYPQLPIYRPNSQSTDTCSASASAQSSLSVTGRFCPSSRDNAGTLRSTPES